jgi:hypothetical protein
MTMRITMIQARLGEAGSVLAAGSTNTVSDQFGAAMVGAGFATDTNGALVPARSSLSPPEFVSVQALVSAAAKTMSVACGLLGQSLPFGAVLTPDADGTPQKTYFAAPSQNYAEPDPYAPGASGSYFTPAIQTLGDQGIRVFFTNTALGGISLIFDACGSVNTNGWLANRAYRTRRTTLAAGDPGTKGEFILEGGRVWESTTGCTHLAFINSDVPVTVEGIVWRRQLSYIAKNTDRTSATTKPTFSGSAIVGDTVDDNGAGSTGGGIVWTCVQVASPAADASSGFRVARNADLYWDPYGIQLRARDAIVGQPVPVNNRYCIVVGTVQTDASANATLIRLSHQLTSNYMAAAQVKTIHSMCLYYPPSTQANYDAYETVLSGANLGVAENYAGSALTTNLAGGGYTLGIPGTTGRAGVIYYYMTSLYRRFGTDVLRMLQTPQPNPHLTAPGALLCAAHFAPQLRRIFLNVAD